MGSRLTLHEELCDILGNTNCYFQPPESLKLKFPCIVYTRYRIVARQADNKNYNRYNQYTVTFITKDPDSDIPNDILDHFTTCRMDRQFTTDNLYHNVFTLYY